MGALAGKSADFHTILLFVGGRDSDHVLQGQRRNATETDPALKGGLCVNTTPTCSVEGKTSFAVTHTRARGNEFQMIHVFGLALNTLHEKSVRACSSVMGSKQRLRERGRSCSVFNDMPCRPHGTYAMVTKTSRAQLQIYSFTNGQTYQWKFTTGLDPW